MMPPLETKLSQLCSLMREGDWKGALSMASKFYDLGDHEEAITRGHAAFQNPRFYQQLKKDPEALMNAGIAALKQRYPFWNGEVPASKPRTIKKRAHRGLL